MKTLVNDGAIEQTRKAALLILLEESAVSDDDTRTLLNAIFDTPDGDEGRWALWVELRERWEWQEALKDGAHPGYDDTGHVEDKQTVLDDVANDITILLNKLATAPVRLRVARAA